MSTSKSMSRRSYAAACLVAAALLLIGPAASAASRVRGVADEVGLGLAAGTCTALYLPFKVFVSATGALVSGAAWAVTGGESEPALTILERTGGGDWLVTQQHLRGDRQFAVLAPERREAVAQRDGDGSGRMAR